jgi:hypothetical protein
MTSFIGQASHFDDCPKTGEDAMYRRIMSTASTAIGETSGCSPLVSKTQHKKPPGSSLAVIAALLAVVVAGHTPAVAQQGLGNYASQVGLLPAQPEARFQTPWRGTLSRSNVPSDARNSAVLPYGRRSITTSRRISPRDAQIYYQRPYSDEINQDIQLRGTN